MRAREPRPRRRTGREAPPRTHTRTPPAPSGSLRFPRQQTNVHNRMCTIRYAGFGFLGHQPGSLFCPCLRIHRPNADKAGVKSHFPRVGSDRHSSPCTKSRGSVPRASVCLGTERRLRVCSAGKVTSRHTLLWLSASLFDREAAGASRSNSTHLGFKRIQGHRHTLDLQIEPIMLTLFLNLHQV